MDKKTKLLKEMKELGKVLAYEEMRIFINEQEKKAAEGVK